MASGTTFLNFGPELDAVFKDAQDTLAAEGTNTALLNKILAAVAGVASGTEQQTQILVGYSEDIQSQLVQVLEKLDEILAWAAPDITPVSVRFVLPTYRNITTGEPIAMATSLMNDVISNVPLEFDNLVGQKVATPSGTITLAVVDTASGAPVTVATAAIGADGTSIDIMPTPADGTNLSAFTVNFDDAANVDLKTSGDFVFTNDPNAANVHMVTTGITTRPFPAPPPPPPAP